MITTAGRNATYTTPAAAATTNIPASSRNSEKFLLLWRRIGVGIGFSLWSVEAIGSVSITDRTAGGGSNRLRQFVRFRASRCSL